MADVQIALRSNPGRYSFSGNAKLINAYAEQQGGDAKDPYAVLPLPGMSLFSATTDTPGRGLIFCDDLNCLYSIHSSGAFKVLQDGSVTRVGTIPGIDQTQISRNQDDPAQISVHTAAGEYYIQADIVKVVTDIDVTSETLVSQDNAKGYTIYLAQSGKFLWSSINDCSQVDGLDFATAEQMADKGTAVKANGSDVYFFGTQTIEPWRVTGDVELPFQLIGGAVQSRGMIAPQAVVASDNTLMFPGEDNSFYRLSSYNPQKISLSYQDRLLEAEPVREGVLGLAYNFQGHAFSTWTGSNWTVGYDAATQMWHDRQSFNLTRWRAQNAVRAWGKTIVQDSQTGNLYFLDGDIFSEDGQPMIWGMDTCFLHNFPNGGIVDALYIDMKTGSGALNTTDGGYDPILMLSWSADGGETFKGNRQIKIGKRGNRIRVSTRRLGRFGSKGIQFRLRISDPVIRAVIAIDATIRPLKK